jgi:hypothetical protein
MTSTDRTDITPNKRSVSTNVWRWRAKIAGPPGPKRQRAEGAPPLPLLRWRRAYRPLWCEIWHQGGAEAEVRIRCRGWEFRFPGSVSLIDAVMAVNGQRGQAWDAFTEATSDARPWIPPGT